MESGKFGREFSRARWRLVRAAWDVIFSGIVSLGSLALFVGLIVGFASCMEASDRPNCRQAGPYDYQCEPEGGNGDGGWGYR